MPFTRYAASFCICKPHNNHNSYDIFINKLDVSSSSLALLKSKMELLTRLAFLLILINKICARSINDTQKLDIPKKLTYLNLTVTYNPDNTTSFSYEFLPVLDTEFEDYQRLLQDQVVEAGGAKQQELSIFPTTPVPYINAAIENFMQILPTVPHVLAETVGNAFSEIYTFLGVNVTEIRTAPLLTATQSISNIAFCNPLFAPVNPGRCIGYFNARIVNSRL